MSKRSNSSLESGGTEDNVTTGSEGPDLDNWYARGSIRWLATDTLEILAKYEELSGDSVRSLISSYYANHCDRIECLPIIRNCRA